MSDETPVHVTTKKEWAKFRDYCLKWIDKYGLTDWRVELRGLHPLNGPYARTTINSDRAALIYLSDSFNNVPDESVTNGFLEHLAMHEVSHLVLGKLHLLAGSRFITESELDEEVEATINRFVNTFGPRLC